jgi:hypothetical protein
MKKLKILSQGGIEHMSSGLLSSISLQSSQSKHFAMYVKKIFFNLSQKVIKMFKRDFRRIFS